jgi:threonine synthase
MDILISSNLERLIYRIAGNDPEKNSRLMEGLAKDGKYEITDEMKQNLQEFYGNYATEEETAGAIRRLYEETGYVMDTHTAVAEAVYEKYRQETKDETKTVIASTASPFKFTRSVMNSIDGKYDALSDFELVDQLSRIAGVRVPKAIEEIRTAPVLHDRVIAAEEMPQAVKEILGV